MKRAMRDSKSFLSYILLLLIVSADLIGRPLAIPQGYRRLTCKLKPFVRASKKNRKHTHPHIPIKEGTSNNWSGYVAATNLKKPQKDSVTDVSGSWIVPKITRSATNTYCAIWIGIDGFTSGTVEQLGTEHDWINGAAQHYAWFEMYPNASYQITGFPVTVGDSISASVVYEGKNVFKLSITNQGLSLPVHIVCSQLI